MGAAKPVDLHVRAAQISHLCFDTGGIPGDLNAELGSKAPWFDFAAFHAILGSMPAAPGHPARSIHDFLEIQAYTQKATLASPRAETSKTALNRTINARANAYYAKYANAPAVIARMNSDFSATVAESKANRLEMLASLSEQQMTLLRQA